MTKALSELGAVDWAAYQDAYGPATPIPIFLQALMSADAQQREEALEHLAAALFHQDIAPCEAFLPALPFLRFAMEHGPPEGQAPLRAFLLDVRQSMADFDFPDGVIPAWWHSLARELADL